VVWDEFRYGNVPPSYHNQEALVEAIRYLNTELGLTDVWVRSDAAACQQDLLETLATWQAARFKRLRFHFINVPARRVRHARQCVVRYFQAGVLALIQAIRGALRALTPT